MTQEEQAVLMIKGSISELSPEQQEACMELAEFIQQNCIRAGGVVGTLALYLVAAETRKRLEEQ